MVRESGCEGKYPSCLEIPLLANLIQNKAQLFAKMERSAAIF
jgi:hypothetical protein